ncbi:uncharacterized protein LOC135217646 [Macrobrachium nipponense]|uniref:uncharacterized protein LOC135217646 n=1 Tax=Macrobrachium nipponense TaxID=159736 RepID=UPI0030C8B392
MSTVSEEPFAMKAIRVRSPNLALESIILHTSQSTRSQRINPAGSGNITLFSYPGREQQQQKFTPASYQNACGTRELYGEWGKRKGEVERKGEGAREEGREGYFSLTTTPTPITPLGVPTPTSPTPPGIPTLTPRNIRTPTPPNPPGLPTPTSPTPLGLPTPTPPGVPTPAPPTPPSIPTLTLPAPPGIPTPHTPPSVRTPTSPIPPHTPNPPATPAGISSPCHSQSSWYT